MHQVRLVKLSGKGKHFSREQTILCAREIVHAPLILFLGIKTSLF